MTNILFKLLSLILITLIFSFSISSNEQPNFKDDWEQVDIIIKKIELPKIKKQSYNIRDFGALGDGQHDDNPAIIDAITQASRQGGGKVIIPAGVWLSKGPVVLESGINLHLSKGATLLFSPDVNDYLPIVKQRWEGTEVYSYSPLIYANNVHDIAITGLGTIDGNNNSDFHAWYKKQHVDMQALRMMGIKGIPVEERQFGMGHYLRPALIQIFGAKRVLLQGYTTKNSPFWVNHLVYTDHATVQNIKVDSHRGNNDGIDIESSTYVLVENSHFRTGDDAVVIKSGRDKDGRDIAKPSKYIVIRNNDMGGEDGIGLGSEMSGGISHVYFTDNILRKGKAAIRFKGSLDRGGIVQHIRVRNMKIAEFDELFWFQLNYPGVLEGGHPSIYRDIVFENIQVEKAGVVLEAHAYQAAPIENILLKNIQIKSADKTFILENVIGLTLENVEINGDTVNGQLSWH